MIWEVTSLSEADFAPEFQADLLSTILTNKERFKQTSAFVTPETFSIPECRWIFEHAKSVFDSTGELPSRGLVAQEAGALYGEGEYEHVIAIHNDLMQGRPAAKEIISSAARFTEDAKYREVARQHDKLVELGKFAEARELMERQNWKVEIEKSVGHKTLMGWDEFEKFTERAKSRRDDPEAFKFSTGVKDLDALMKGGYRRQHMILILGWTGRGKSTVSVNMASTNVRNGFCGIYISTEMGVDEIFAKMVARETMTAYDIIYEYGFDAMQEERFLKQVQFKAEQFKQKLFIRQTGIEGTNRASILQALEDASQHFGKYPDWSVLDTIDHCQGDKFKKKNEAMGDNVNWYSGLLEDYDMAGIVTTQANRDGSGETDESHAANTIESARVAPWIIAVNEPEENSRPDPHASVEELMKPRDVYQSKVLSLVKARFGRKGDVPVSTNLECSFIGDMHLENMENR